jgi:AAA domain
MTTLPEYADNQYIRVLPPILTPKGYRQAIAQDVPFNEGERLLPHELRYHCVLRLRRFFHAGPRQVDFARGFDAVLRQGYLGRGDGCHEHEARQLDVALSLARQELLDASRPPVVSRLADSSFLMGVPGMGKSLTVSRVLGRYSQVVHHDSGETQIVWLKLECPPRGSIRALCLDFFEQVDALLGQKTYQTLYAGANASEDAMMGHMALVANRHSLGCLIVDEIQHLGKSTVEEHLLMTFLTALINKIGVPLLCIGTMSAHHLIERTARMSRRAVGLAHAIWVRLDEDTEWKQFVSKLWRFQWTAEHTPLDDALSAELYKHTQGVIDLVIKLFMAVQFRLIDNNYATGGKLREVMTPEVIAAAAKKHFGPVQDMMLALRSKDPKAIRKFDDLTEFHTEFMRSLSITSGAVLNEEDGDEEAAFNAQHPAFRGQASNAVYRAFKDNGFEADRIDEAMKSVFAELGQPDFINLTEFLRRTDEYLKPTRKKKAGAARKTKADQRESYVDGDLRKIAEDASAAGASVAAAINQSAVSKAA